MPDDTTAPVAAEAIAPEWADQLLESLSVALGCKGTAAEWLAEDELIAAAHLLVRARLGHAATDDPMGIVRWRIDRALKALESEENER
jgi:hypothetical protein